MENIDLISIITIALFGSFGHCIGMCGGIVLAYTSTKVNNTWTKLHQSTSHLLYSLGRISSYTMLGVIFGFIGQVFTFDNFTRGILLGVTGFLMILIGVSLSGKIKFITKIEHSISKYDWYQKTFKKLISSSSPGSFYFLGILNGLLPCGFVYMFAITAISTGNPFWGAVVMFIFGVCTIPALFLLGVFVGLFQKTELRNWFVKIASILILLFGFYTMYKGYKFLSTSQLQEAIIKNSKS